mgnify:CR=1
MLTANFFLAESIIPNNNNSFIINAPNTVFTALSFPAFLSLDAALVVSGVDPSSSSSLVVTLLNSDHQTIKELLTGEAHPSGPKPGKGEVTTLTAVLNLKKIPIQKEGIYYLSVTFNGIALAESPLNAVLATDDL